MHSQWVEFINNKVSGASAVANAPEVGDASITISPAHIKNVCLALRDGEHQFNVLQVITGCDWPEAGEIEVTYILASFIQNTELLLKVRLPRGTDDNLPKIDSVASVWKSANFQERECYDMIGVEFVGHPDFRRVLCPDDWKGHPLRKDYVVEEVYNKMVVNPEHKMNIGEREFGARHEHLDGGATSVDNYTTPEAN